ncbi:MAG: hypothetical protein RSC44_04970, partial [Clostridia bacterium]
ICGNTFACCGHQNHWATVLIKPENISVNKDKPVHKNIKIENNNFQLSGTTAISAKCAKNIAITNNTFSGDTSGKPLFVFKASDEIVLKDNIDKTNGKN